MTCGACLYPDNPKCVTCEIVGHCSYALKYLKTLQSKDIPKGVYFKEQLTGEENLYQTLTFVNAQQFLINHDGNQTYLKNLEKKNLKSAKTSVVMK